MMKRIHVAIGILAAMMSLPSTAYAAGGATIRDLVVDTIHITAPLWVTAGVLVIVIAGFTLMLSHDEGATEKAKKTIIGVSIGGMIITVLTVFEPLRLIGLVYNGMPGFGVTDTSAAFQAEAEGLASWISTLAAMAGIVTIIVAMIRAAASFGADEGAYTNVRTALLHVVAGMIVIAAAYVIRDVFFVIHEPSPLLAFIVDVLSIVLGLITFIAVVILIYAGVRMVTSFGREDDFNAAKSLMVRVLVGLFIILVSYVLVQTVVLAFNGGGNAVSTVILP